MITGFFTEFYWVSLNFVRFHRFLLGVTGFSWILLGFTEFHGISFDFH